MRTSSRCRKSIGAGPAGAGQAEEIGAAVGMGWVMASVRAAAQSSVRQRHPEPLPDRPSQPVRPVVAHVRAARVPARRPRSRGGQALHIYNVHLGTAVLERRYQATRLAVVRPRSPRRGPEDHPRRLQRVDARPRDQDAQLAVRERRHLRPPETPPHLSRASFRSSTSITSITRDRSRSAAVEMTRSRKALMASDHLPLVADLRIGF